MTAALDSRDVASHTHAGDPAVDVAFALAGGPLPPGHRAALRDALTALLPWLAIDEVAAIHPLSHAEGDGLPLSHRARLVVRVRASRAAEALTLHGRTLDVAGSALRIGEGRAKAVAPYPTVGAAFVATMAGDDLAHQRAVEAMLDAAALPRRFVCGRLVRVSTGEGEIAGARVVVHQLSASDSLRLQHAGLGPHRALGCGVFVPHKTISGLD